MKFSSIFSTLLIIASSLAESINVDKDIVTKGNYKINYGAVYVEDGKTYELLDNEYVHFHGSFYNAGKMFVASDDMTKALHFRLDGLYEHKNNGELVLTSGDSHWSPRFRIDGQSFTNNGKLWVKGGGAKGLPVTNITPRHTTNKGTIQLYQDSRNSGKVHLGGLWTTFTNDGTVCLRNLVYSQQTKIEGKGCFDIGENSNVWIQYATLPVSNDQVFHFSTNSGSIRVEAVSAPQTFNISNWGEGNILGLSWPISSYRYSEDGTLTLSNGELEFHFNIGPGYDISKMRKISPDFGQAVGTVINGGLIYEGTAPKTDRPQICKPCEDVPVAPSL